LRPFEAEPPTTRKVWRVGILSMAPAAETPVFEAFRKTVQQLGYVEEKTILLDFRLSAGR